MTENRSPLEVSAERLAAAELEADDAGAKFNAAAVRYRHAVDDLERATVAHERALEGLPS